MMTILISFIFSILGLFGFTFLIKYYYWITYIPSNRDLFFDIRERNTHGLPVIKTRGFSMTIRHSDLNKYDGILEIKNIGKKEVLIEEISLLFPKATHESLFRIGTNSPFDLFPTQITYERKNGIEYCKHNIAFNIKIDPNKGEIRNVAMPTFSSSKAEVEIKKNRGNVKVLTPKLESPFDFFLRIKCRFNATDWMQLLGFIPKSIEIEKNYPRATESAMA